jgi:hypothetical protein
MFVSIAKRIISIHRKATMINRLLNRVIIIIDRMLNDTDSSVAMPVVHLASVNAPTVHFSIVIMLWAVQLQNKQ